MISNKTVEELCLGFRCWHLVLTATSRPRFMASFAGMREAGDGFAAEVTSVRQAPGLASADRGTARRAPTYQAAGSAAGMCRSLFFENLQPRFS